MKKSNSFATAGFIFVLMLIRVVCHAADSILVIIYTINVVGFLYVVTQIMHIVYDKLNTNIGVNSKNVVIIRRNRKVKNKYVWSTIVITILLIAGALVLCYIKDDTIFSIVNDIIALITLGISIEDNALQEYLYKKVVDV